MISKNDIEGMAEINSALYGPEDTAEAIEQNDKQDAVERRERLRETAQAMRHRGRA